MASQTSKTVMITARLPHEMIRQIDDYLADLQKAAPPGVVLNRTDAVRALIHVGLDHVPKTVRVVIREDEAARGPFTAQVRIQTEKERKESKRKK